MQSLSFPFNLPPCKEFINCDITMDILSDSTISDFGQFPLLPAFIFIVMCCGRRPRWQRTISLATNVKKEPQRKFPTFFPIYQILDQNDMTHIDIDIIMLFIDCQISRHISECISKGLFWDVPIYARII